MGFFIYPWQRGLDRGEQITVRALTPDEAIGARADENFVIRKGKERVIEAVCRGVRGRAFTDAPGNREETLDGLHTILLVIAMFAVTDFTGQEEIIFPGSTAFVALS